MPISSIFSDFLILESSQVPKITQSHTAFAELCFHLEESEGRVAREEVHVSFGHFFFLEKIGCSMHTENHVCRHAVQVIEKMYSL